MKDHPLAELFPLMDDAELKELAEDIKIHGQRAPITLLAGKILDGRNRWRACTIAKITPKTRQFENGGDPLEFVISANLHRRHLTIEQRAFIAAKFEKMKHGGSRRTDQDAPGHLENVTREQISRQLSVSPRSVARAKIVLTDPKRTAEVEAGTKTLTKAAAELSGKTNGAHPDVIKDATGYPVPNGALEFWERADEVEEILSAISKARSAVRNIGADKDRMYVETNINGVMADLNKAYTAMQTSVPHAVCPTCQGQAPKTCTLCRGRGVISKFKFNTCVPEEIKAIRAKSIK